MSEQDDKLLRRLLPIFKEEARERISTISTRLGELDHAAGEERAALVEVMFREAHSLKAAARAVGQEVIELICQSMESVFAALKTDTIALSDALRDALRAAADALDDISASVGAPASDQQQAVAAKVVGALDAGLKHAEPTAPGATAEPARTVDTEAAPIPETEPEPVAEPPAPVRNDLEAAAPDVAPVNEPPPEPAQPAIPLAAAGATTDTIRLSVQRLNTLLLQTEEMIAEKLAVRRLAADLKEASGTFSEWKSEWDKASAATPQLRPLLGERNMADPLYRAARQVLKFLEWTDHHMNAFEASLGAAEKDAATEAHGIGLKVDRLLYAMKQILTLPCESLLQLIPRVVRDLARAQGKDVELTIRGGELEIDRRILEELKDPLLHLVRNCIDHGIELPQARLAAGKPARASITLRVAAQEGDKVEFVIADDGGGIATAKLASAAVKLGLLTEQRAATASDPELLPLIFQSGVSTSPMITDLSGRGLGLAIVREKVERLGGAISVESQRGVGTTFRIVLPLTLAMYHGITVRVAERIFVLPTFSADRVVRVKRNAVATVETRTMIDVGGTPVPLVRLRDVLELHDAPAGKPDGDWLVAVVLGAAARRVAFEVDAVEGDQEILMKPLGKCFVRVRNVQGATILPDGTIAAILNVHDLIKSAGKVARAAAHEAVARDPDDAKPRSILVAEDSITARGLLKNILEAAGYRIKTAVDGMEAWSMLKLEPFDLLVSDVEMPRMNGFELTGRIRGDKALADLPVVLVTALESREDLERGVDVGANAYILKGGFEQGRLLEAVRRLV